ncbi:UbiA family prenyltransferase [Streptomyces sp. NPDC005574]|uniref:UbiA family prenyltransferase n=1 Tax=Streptomyces sp. NPDC005574 TaxID=3156891 RepID=UPI0033B7EB53
MFLAPLAAGLLSHPIALWKSAAAFAIVSLAASGTYFLNDARDAAGDRQHPQKKNRPVAAGTISPLLAYVVAAALIVVSLTLAVMVLNPRARRRLPCTVR